MNLPLLLHVFRFNPTHALVSVTSAAVQSHYCRRKDILLCLFSFRLCVFGQFFFFHLLVFPYITVHLTSHWHHTLEPTYEIESICRELLLATPFRGRHRGSSAMSPYPSILLCQFNPVIFHYIYECSL